MVFVTIITKSSKGDSQKSYIEGGGRIIFSILTNFKKVKIQNSKNRVMDKIITIQILCNINNINSFLQ
uniref:Uncharacterized protein n=1 Tax=viral metagenome TaxID=1070528 RepID=A0A6C0KWZ9_9ZZZZ